jgi:hypothetical protein
MAFSATLSVRVRADAWSLVPGTINNDTVEALLSEVEDLIDAEESRSQSLMSRGTGLAGLVGLIVSVVGLVAGRMSSNALDAAPVGLVLGFFIAGVACMLLAVLAVVVFVLLPGTGYTTSLEDVRRYPTWEFITQEKVMVQGRRMRGLIRALERERSRNTRKARSLRTGYFFLLLGVYALAIDGLLLGYYREARLSLSNAATVGLAAEAINKLGPSGAATTAP